MKNTGESLRWIESVRKASAVIAIIGMLAAACPISLKAESPNSLYNKGRAAEIKGDSIAAYEFFKQAYALKPDDLRYRIAYDRSRLYAAAEHVKRGQKLRADGKLDEAIAEFQAGLTADPELFTAGQELEATQNLKQKQAGGGQQAQPKPNDQNERVLRQMVEQAPGPVQLSPLNNDLITLNLTEDSKKIYQTIGQLAGLNVIFDPEYTGRRVPVQLDHVTLSEALNVVATMSQTFWTPVTANTILIAANNQNRRTEMESQVYKTIYLGNITGGTGGTNELGELVTAIRAIVGQRIKLQAIQSQNAIAIRGTPDEVALAEKISQDFDKARPEVVVDVVVMQVRREKVRDLGIIPPVNGTTIQLIAPGTTSTTTTGGGTGTGGTGITGTTGGTGSTTTTSNPVTLNTFNNLTASNFAVSIPPVTLNALLNDSNTRILENPRVRGESGSKASLKIGDRYPIAQGSYQPGLAGLGGVTGLNALVGTNFQYVDVGVNIDITPTVFSNNDVGLKLTLDISSVTSNVNIGGIQQPIISQRKVDHEIRLKDGEINVLAGIIDQQDIKSWQGLPYFDQLPVLRYFFGSEHHDKVEDEIVFVLVPHILRGQFLTDENKRTIDIGTNAGIDLRRRSATSGAGAVNPQAPPVQDVRPAQQQNPAGGTTQPATQNPPTTPQAANTGDLKLILDPAQASHQVGETFAVNVNIANAKDVASVPIQITFDPKQLAVVNVSSGGFLSSDGQAAAVLHRQDDDKGQLTISATRPPDSAGLNGNGTVYTLTLQAKAQGKSVLAITRPGARNAQQVMVPALGSQAEITIR